MIPDKTPMPVLVETDPVSQGFLEVELRFEFSLEGWDYVSPDLCPPPPRTLIHSVNLKPPGPPPKHDMSVTFMHRH